MNSNRTLKDIMCKGKVVNRTKVRTIDVSLNTSKGGYHFVRLAAQMSHRASDVPFFERSQKNDSKSIRVFIAGGSAVDERVAKANEALYADKSRIE